MRVSWPRTAALDCRILAVWREFSKDMEDRKHAQVRTVARSPQADSTVTYTPLFHYLRRCRYFLLCAILGPVSKACGQSVAG